jgi:cysteine desulfurase
MGRIYFFDNYQTTPLSEKVKEIIKKESENWLLPYRFIKQGVERQKLILEAKDKILESFNTNFDNYNVNFVQDGAVANALILKSVAKKFRGKNFEIIAEKIACPSIMATLKELEKEGVKVNYINVDSKGNIDLEHLEELINENTALVSITHVNHILGTVQNIEKISKIVKENSNAMIHLNAQWSYFKEEIDLNKLGIDFVTISAYKIHGPMISAIISKKTAKYHNIVLGKDFESLDKNYPNIPYIAGFKVAVEEKMESYKKDNKKIKELRDYLWKKIQENIDEIELLGPSLNENRDVANLLVLFKRLEGESIYYDLSLDNIIVSTTSACAHEQLQANYVILSIGRRHEDSHGSVRFTLSKMNEKEEIDFLVEKLKASVERLRKITAYTPDYDYEKIKQKKK